MMVWWCVYRVGKSSILEYLYNVFKNKCKSVSFTFFYIFCYICISLLIFKPGFQICSLQTTCCSEIIDSFIHMLYINGKKKVVEDRLQKVCIFEVLTTAPSNASGSNRMFVFWFKNGVQHSEGDCCVEAVWSTPQHCQASRRLHWSGIYFFLRTTDV